MSDKMKPIEHWIEKNSGLVYGGIVVGDNEVREVYSRLVATGLTNGSTDIAFYGGALLGRIAYDNEQSEDRITLTYNGSKSCWVIRVGFAFTVTEPSTNLKYTLMTAINKAKEQAKIAEELIADCDPVDEITYQEALEELGRFSHNLCRLLGLFYQLTVWE